MPLRLAEAPHPLQRTIGIGTEVTLVTLLYSGYHGVMRLTRVPGCLLVYSRSTINKKLNPDSDSRVSSCSHYLSKMMTRRSVGTPMANPNNKGPGKSQQTTGNRNKATRRRPGTGKPSNIQLATFPSPPHRPFFTFFIVVCSAAEDHPESTPAPPGRKKTGGPPPMRVHAAPVVMDDGSDIDMPATASQDRNPPVVTHTHRQTQALNKSTSYRRSVRTSHRVVPDDEEEEDEEDIYGGVDGDVLGNEVRQLSHWHIFQVYVS